MQDVFDSIFSSVNAFTYRCGVDDTTEITHLHGAVGPMLGYKSVDFLGRKPSFYLDLIHEEDQTRMREDIAKNAAAGLSWDIAYRLRHADGTFVPVRERGSMARETGGAVFQQGLVVGAEAETELNTHLEELLINSEAKNAEILDVTFQIARSFQYLNMLSINAGIEAARSGDAGKGFAVVASQIKTLVNENGQWAGKIRDLVSRSGSSTQTSR